MNKLSNKSILLDHFQKNSDKSFTGNELVSELKPIMNKATVYRQLTTLEAKNLIRKSFNVHLGSYEYTFQPNIDCENHLHLKCTQCGKTIHLECTIVEDFLAHLSEVHEFKINKYLTNLNGLCKECQ